MPKPLSITYIINRLVVTRKGNTEWCRRQGVGKRNTECHTHEGNTETECCRRQGVGEANTEWFTHEGNTEWFTHEGIIPKKHSTIILQ